MTARHEPEMDEHGSDADLLASLFVKADCLLLKKLSNNDRDWARLRNKHQAGVYIPRAQRDGGFFPPLALKQRQRSDSSDIREIFFRTLWPQTEESEHERPSRLVHYTSKGQETHLTGLPKELFADLSPASWLIMGRFQQQDGLAYECLTIDSASDEATLIAEFFDIGPDFSIGVFDPAKLKEIERDRILDFAEEVIAAWLEGQINTFARRNAALPAPRDLAQMAQDKFMEKYGIDQINPFVLEKPGDALMEMSRGIEWSLFREYQRRERSVLLVRTVMGDIPFKATARDIIRRLIDEFPSIDALMLSASQQRKSRAGLSYEHHIEAMLRDGNIPFEKQVIIEARKRPDFILPSLDFLESSAHSNTGLILSAKTTLRERWKQVEREKGKCNLFLTTVDENIAGNAIEDMAGIGIRLVVPESLLTSKESEYKGHQNIMSFRQFCDDIVAPNLAAWA